MGNLTSLLVALAAVGLGISISYQPLYTAIAVAGMAVILLSVLSPQKTSYLLLILSAISLLGDQLQLHKLGILLLSLPAILRYGMYGKRVAPIAAFTSILVFTYLLADRPPLLGAMDPLATFIGMASPFIMLLIRWPKSVADMHIKLICVLPLISVFIGFLFEAAGISPLFMNEFTGATRLQGANIPPHLAFLAFMAFMVATIEAKRRPDRLVFYYAMMSVNFLILVLTGTRGGLVSLMLMIFIFMYDLTKQFLKGKSALIIPLFGFAAVLVSSVWLQLDNLKKRSFERATEVGIDLSGRLEAWDFFLKGVEGSPWFGKGLGAVLVANDGSLYEGFMVPHNEYIRFYYDGGIIGAVLLFASILYVFRNVIRENVKELRRYMTVLMLGFLIYSISDNTLSSLQFTLPLCIYLNASSALSGTVKEKSA